MRFNPTVRQFSLRNITRGHYRKEEKEEEKTEDKKKKKKKKKERKKRKFTSFSQKRREKEKFRKSTTFQSRSMVRVLTSSDKSFIYFLAKLRDRNFLNNLFWYRCFYFFASTTTL